MRVRTAFFLTVIAVPVLGAGLYYGLQPAGESRPEAASAATLAFPGLTSQLGNALRVEITSKGQTLAIVKAGADWGLADRGFYPVQPDKLRELLTGLTELRLTEKRTSDPALLERLGVDDPGAIATSTLVRVLDGNGQALAALIVGHRRVRPQANAPETVYVRRPGEAQAWLAEGRLPVEADPQLWLDRDIANIDAKTVASVVVHRGETTLEFGRDGDKAVLKQPAEHPKLDDYRVEEVFRALEMLTLTDVKPAAQLPGENIGSATIATSDGMQVEVTLSGVAKTDAKAPETKEIWIHLTVRGESEAAKKLAARVNGWAYQIGSWKEKAFVPTLDDLKVAAETTPAAPAPAPGATETAPLAPAANDEKKSE